MSACKEASLEILGHKEKSKKYDSDDIKNLSEQQKQIRQDINATQDKSKRNELQKKRNEKMREIRKAINDKETRKLMENIKEIEDSKDDSIRMYKALKQINRNKPKSEIIAKK